MLIGLNLDSARLWRWHAQLIDQLSALPDVRVTVTFDPVRKPLPRALSVALQLEEAVTARALHPFDTLTPPDFARWTGTSDTSDFVIDLAADAPTVARLHRLTPLYNGICGEIAFWAAILDGKAPRLDLWDSRTETGRTIGLPALEAPHIVRRSAGGIIIRLISGLVATVRAPAAPGPIMPSPTKGCPRRLVVETAGLLARKVTRRARSRIKRLLDTTPQWSVAWKAEPPGADPAQTAPFADRILRLADYTLLPDDRQRYYADPFFFSASGQLDLFVEEVPYATGQGIISVASLQRDGRFSKPRPVLELGHHLSYPQVFAHDGAVFMLPEASSSGALILYRARRYPDGWEPVAHLVEEPLHDATLFQHAGRFWIAANSEGPASARWGSSWDALHIYSAPGLLGPYVPHPSNPVLIDASSTRGAGMVTTLSNRLFRPVQNCAHCYGYALGFAEIIRLTEDGYAQSVVARQAFASLDGPGWLSEEKLPVNALLGPHTFNMIAHAGKTFEAIDVFGAPHVITSQTREPVTGGSSDD